MDKTEEFYRFYQDKMLCDTAEPNAAHLKLAELEKAGKLKVVITQNIDNLHQMAGSENVLELHGSVHRNYCMKCGKFYGFTYMKESQGVPRCEVCQGTIKPDVVLYGEGLDNDTINKSVQGLQFAAMPMISQNIAAREQKRARQVVLYVWLFAFVLTVFFMALYVIFGRQLFMLFSDDVAVHDLSGTFIRAILWMFPALTVMRGSNAFVQGIGNAKLSMVLSLLDGVVLRIGLSWLFGIVLDWGFYGFVLGYGLAPYGCAVPGMLYFLSGVWQRRKVLAEDI